MMLDTEKLKTLIAAVCVVGTLAVIALELYAMRFL
jgi:hypothetical protein